MSSRSTIFFIRLYIIKIQSGLILFKWEGKRISDANVKYETNQNSAVKQLFINFAYSFICIIYV